MIGPSSFKAILFDMDGTLVNSEPLHMQAWFDTIEPLNLDLAEGWFHEWTGSTDRKLMTFLVDKFSLDADSSPNSTYVNTMLNKKRDRFLEISNTQTQTFNGVHKGLTHLQNNYQLALVTSSSRMGADHVLKLAEINHFFKTTITFDDVINHKPHPEPYLNAAKFFNLSPQECIAVEDSVSGTKSAKAAGCYTISVLNSVRADELDAADLILETTEEVMDYLKGLKN